MPSIIFGGLGCPEEEGVQEGHRNQAVMDSQLFEQHFRGKLFIVLGLPEIDQKEVFIEDIPEAWIWTSSWKLMSPGDSLLPAQRLGNAVP